MRWSPAGTRATTRHTSQASTPSEQRAPPRAPRSSRWTARSGRRRCGRRWRRARCWSSPSMCTPTCSASRDHGPAGGRGAHAEGDQRGLGGDGVERGGGEADRAARAARGDHRDTGGVPTEDGAQEVGRGGAAGAEAGRGRHGVVLLRRGRYRVRGLLRRPGQRALAWRTGRHGTRSGEKVFGRHRARLTTTGGAVKCAAGDVRRSVTVRHTASPSAAMTSAVRGCPAARRTIAARRVEHQHGGGPADAEFAHEREMRLGVDLDVGDAVDHPGHLGEGAPGGPAGRAEGAGELHEGGPLPQFRAEFGRVQPAASVRPSIRGLPLRALRKGSSTTARADYIPGLASGRDENLAPRARGWPRASRMGHDRRNAENLRLRNFRREHPPQQRRRVFIPHGRARLSAGHRLRPHAVQGVGPEDRLPGFGEHPATGGAVLVSNHISYLDFIFTGLAALPQKRLVRFMAKESVFRHKVSGPLMRGMKHIPVDRDAGRGGVRARARLAARRRDRRGVPRGDDLPVLHPEELQVGRRAPGPGGGRPAGPDGAVGHPAAVDQGPPAQLQAQPHPDHHPGRRGAGGAPPTSTRARSPAGCASASRSCWRRPSAPTRCAPRTRATPGGCPRTSAVRLRRPRRLANSADPPRVGGNVTPGRGG